MIGHYSNVLFFESDQIPASAAQADHVTYDAMEDGKVALGEWFASRFDGAILKHASRS